MVTRSDVMRNARQYLNIQGWSPRTDVHVFDPNDPSHTFHSAYEIAQAPVTPAQGQSRPMEYDVMPYVFGGNDDFPTGIDSRSAFLMRIQNGVCPGGWDRTTGQPTTHWYRDQPNGLGYGYHVARNLAGIDCSGYVSRSWGLRGKYGTSTLPNICLEIDRSELKEGDILNRRGRHVRIFVNAVGSNQIRVFESVGGGRRRSYRPGDEIGRVVDHIINWDENYTPLSPFPQFSEFAPAPATYARAQNPRPEISGRCRGSGGVEIAAMGVNDASIPFSGSSVSDGAAASYNPCGDLPPGRYKVTVIAINHIARTSFRDEFSWEFDLV